MKIAICDDDKAYIEEIKKYVDFFMFEHNISADYSTFDNIDSLLQNTEYYDIAFLY